MRLLISLILLTGCASPMVVTEATPRAVVVQCGIRDGWSYLDGALTLAEEHCQKYNRHAVANGESGHCGAAYRCVE
jgi:uncharacterized protein YjhX (UPF0386 family)